MMAYRSSEHETTGFTPNMMMLGREISVPLDIQFGSPVETEYASEWVKKLREKFDQAHDIARNNIDSEMLRQKRYHDSKVFWEQFKRGDKVFIYNPARQPGRSRKLCSFWRGPFVVVERLSDVTHRVKDEERNVEQVVHIDRMKVCHPRLGDLNQIGSEETLCEVVDKEDSEYN